ncbi:MAG TPA: PilZ domain-containing protein [Solirubrobacteraceae bacterium]
MTEQIDIPAAPSNVLPLPGSGQGKLTTPTGEELPVRTFERGHEVVLVVLVDTNEHEQSEPLASAELEYTSIRGVVRLHGEAVFEDRSLIRFRAHGDAAVTQRRSFVRVTTPQAVTLTSDDDGERRVHTVDLSGGGMLLAGADTLETAQIVRFSMALGDGGLPVQGEARVLRIREDGKRALVFQQIDKYDRQRLIRFVFECMRTARARTRGDFI